MRAAIAVAGLLLLGGCMADTPAPDQPTMYLSMANGGATLDPVAAASMISLYRQNNGLGAVAVDPDLMKLAEQQSQAMASRNKLDHDVKGALAKRLGKSRYPATVAGAKGSAGDYKPGRGLFGRGGPPPPKGKNPPK